MRELENKFGIVTGASYGIGRAISIELAKHGCKILMVSRNNKKLSKTKEIIEENNGNATYIPLDISKINDIERLKIYLLENKLTLDFLINNASGWVSGPLLKSSDASLKTLFRTTIFGTTIFTKKLIPFIKENNGGNIIFIGSTAGTMHRYSLNTAYVTAKNAVAGLSRCLRNEVRRFDIRVSTIHLGQVYEEYPYDTNNKNITKANKKISTQDITDAVIFILSREKNTIIDEIVITPTKTNY